jgi:reactive intermediate/imine deaminase
MKQVIRTNKAPKAIGTYSQAVKAGNVVYLSGQIPFNPEMMEIVQGGAEKQIAQVFENLKAVAEAAGGNFDNIVKLTVFLTDLNNFPKVNEVMAKYFQEPYPARAVVQVSRLPRDVEVEMDAIMALED